MGKKVILMRHADNEHDWSKGDMVSITNAGKKQIESSASLIGELAGHLGNVLILHSALLRAKETAQALREHIHPYSTTVASSCDNNINGKTALEIGEVFFGLMSPHYLQHHMPSGNPDSVFIITHAHNPLGLYIQSMLDPLSTIPCNSKMHEFNNADLLHACFDEDKDDPPPSSAKTYSDLKEHSGTKGSFLRSHFGGTQIFELSQNSWEGWKLGDWTRTAAFSPYIPQNL